MKEWGTWIFFGVNKNFITFLDAYLSHPPDRNFVPQYSSRPVISRPFVLRISGFVEFLDAHHQLLSVVYRESNYLRIDNFHHSFNVPYFSFRSSSRTWDVNYPYNTPWKNQKFTSNSRNLNPQRQLPFLIASFYLTLIWKVCHCVPKISFQVAVPI